MPVGAGPAPFPNSQGRPGKQAAVFLDRDGVLCTEKGYVTQVGELEIFPYVKSCIGQLHQMGFLAVCITNQSAVARGMMPEATLVEMNRYLCRETGIDDVFYCPHYPGLGGKYGIACSCRKPGTGMVEQAITKYGIDRDTSYLVGDRASDILCGRRAGLRTVLLESGYGTAGLEQQVAADFVYYNLEEFVKKMMA